MVNRGAGGGTKGMVGAIGDRVTDTVVTTTDMASERPKRLHNFTLPTPELTWGNQKFLRCTKADSGAADAFDRQNQHQRSYAGSETDCRSSARRNRHFDFEFNANRRSRNGNSLVRGVNVKHKIKAIREKLMFDLKTAADNMKLSILDVNIEANRFEEDEPPPPPPPVVSAAMTEERPWNLRTRLASCKAAIDDNKASSFSLERIDNTTKPSRLRVCSNDGETERSKLSVALSRKEIAEDYTAMIGGKPPRRPKKRSKTIQKQIDALFPGLWLTEVTPEMYKVDEVAESVMR